MLNESVESEFKSYIESQDKVTGNIKDTKNLAEL